MPHGSMNIWHFQAPRSKNYLTVQHALSVEDLHKMNAIADSINTEAAKVHTHGQYQVDVTYRRSRIAWLESRDHDWLYERLRTVGTDMNTKHFGFDLMGMASIQFTEYRADDQGCYDGHMDMMPTVPARKLSFCIQLTDPSEYEGGDLELLMTDRKTITASKAAGDGMMFPSYIIHRVKPVTKGIRRSLVCWMVGPEFR